MTQFDWEEKFVDKDAPLHQMVYHALHYAIISGQVQPGDHLPEHLLSQHLKVSRTPIRTAIIELEKEGLVVRRHGRTIVQDSLDREMREILETRNALEKLAVLNACRNASEEDILRLKEINETFAKALKNGDVMCSAQTDEQFHEEIYQIADNRVLLRTLHSLELPLYGYRIRACKNEQDVEEQIQEHEEIIEAIVERDELRAEKAVMNHIQGRRYDRCEEKETADTPIEEIKKWA